MRNLILSLYQSKEGRSPFELSFKATIAAGMIALLLTFLVGNTVIRGIHQTAIQYVNENPYQPPNKQATLEQCIEELTSIPCASIPPEVLASTLFQGGQLTNRTLEEWLIHTGVEPGNLEAAIVGELSNPIFPTLQIVSPNQLAQQWGFSKPGTEKNLKAEDWQYYLAVSAIKELRNTQMRHYGQPLRLCIALGGAIQWITFYIAFFAAMVLCFKYLFASAQIRLIKYGSFSGEGDIWDIEKEDPNNKPFYWRLQQAYPKLLLAPNLISHLLKGNIRDLSFIQISEKIDDWVKKEKERCEEDELLEVLKSGTTQSGFVGTLIGLALCFGNAIGFLEASQYDKADIFSTLISNLGIAYDTSLIGILALMCLMFISALVIKKENKVFHQLASVAKEKLRIYTSVKSENEYFLTNTVEQ